MYRLLIAVAWALAAVLLATPAAEAQGSGGESHPLAVLDSTYAIRIVTDRWAEAIRHADTGPRSVLDAEVGAATRRLSDAARARKRVAPQRQLGILWDFRVEIDEIQPVGRNQIRARGRAFLGQDAGSAAPVTLVFERRGSEWVLARHENVSAWMTAQAARFAQGRTR